MENQNTETSELHTFPIRAFTEKSAAENSLHRLVVIRWKEKKLADGTKVPARAPLCVSIPKLELTVTPTILQASLQAAYNDIVDTYIRSCIEADFEAGRTVPKSLDASQLTASNVAAWQAEQATSGRLSGELIENWFDANLRDYLEEAFAQMTNIDTDEKLEKAIAQYRTGLTNLASPRANFPVHVAEQMEKAIHKLPDYQNDMIANKLLSRIQTFKSPKSVELEFAL